MLSRRDKLLILPWQQKRYNHHLRKVQAALPAIDNQPPATRNHVAVKLKRKQHECERSRQIEKDNFILLQKLACIMRTNRVDNSWTTPQPDFLNRTGVYKVGSKEELKTEISDLKKTNGRIRTAKCLACTPQKTPATGIPEERVPWEITKSTVRRIRSKSVPAQKLATLPTVKEHSSSLPTTPDENISQKTKEYSKSAQVSNKKRNSIKQDVNIKTSQSIVLSRGSLVLAVNFPSDAFVKFHDAGSEKFITRDFWDIQ